MRFCEDFVKKPCQDHFANTTLPYRFSAPHPPSCPLCEASREDGGSRASCQTAKCEADEDDLIPGCRECGTERGRSGGSRRLARSRGAGGEEVEELVAGSRAGHRHGREERGWRSGEDDVEIYLAYLRKYC